MNTSHSSPTCPNLAASTNTTKTTSQTRRGVELHGQDTSNSTLMQCGSDEPPSTDMNRMNEGRNQLETTATPNPNWHNSNIEQFHAGREAGSEGKERKQNTMSDSPRRPRPFVHSDIHVKGLEKENESTRAQWSSGEEDNWGKEIRGRQKRDEDSREDEITRTSNETQTNREFESRDRRWNSRSQGDASLVAREFKREFAFAFDWSKVRQYSDAAQARSLEYTDKRKVFHSSPYFLRLPQIEMLVNVCPIIYSGARECVLFWTGIPQAPDELPDIEGDDGTGNVFLLNYRTFEFYTYNATHAKHAPDMVEEIVLIIAAAPSPSDVPILKLEPDAEGDAALARILDRDAGVIPLLESDFRGYAPHATEPDEELMSTDEAAARQREKFMQAIRNVEV
ncbi:hypothetical protein B0H13DRAFT_2485144 [Mycena leptocephala]|nr:hypothetical protein B0H13DRAFT_2485144 [Mycena leptocephala]